MSTSLSTASGPTAAPVQAAAESLGAQQLQALLLYPGELAVLDVREARQMNRSHLNLARHAPLSGLELQVGAFVPRRSTPIVLIDAEGAAGGPAERAQALLVRLGYRAVRSLQGGLAAWVAEGLPVIDGYNTLVKAFADLARVHFKTPVLSLNDLDARRRGGLPTTLIDARPAAEFGFLTIEGARNVPGTELALRRFAHVDPESLWAVHCFSRTRGIIGTTTLRLLGRTDRAVFVEDGVMAWALRGAPVTQNARNVDDLPQDAPEVLRSLAEGLLTRYGLRRIDAAGLAALREDAERSLYVFDLRPGEGPSTQGARRFRHVPGGQLLMHFENHVGTRGARIVLIDEPHGLRAAVTAFWLTQLNQAEVYVFDGPPPLAGDAAGAESGDGHADAAQETGLEAGAVAALLEAHPVQVIDVGPSLDFERQHLPGALFLLPTSLDPAAPLLASGHTVVFTSPDGAAARLAARDAALLQPAAKVAWLRGGTQAWKASGGAVESAYDAAQLLTPFDDNGGSVMRVFGAPRDAAWKAYLDWERGVGARVAQDPAVRFRFFD